MLSFDVDEETLSRCFAEEAYAFDLKSRIGLWECLVDMQSMVTSLVMPEPIESIDIDMPFMIARVSIPHQLVILGDAHSVDVMKLKDVQKFHWMSFHPRFLDEDQREAYKLKNKLDDESLVLVARLIPASYAVYQLRKESPLPIITNAHYQPA